MSSKAGSGQQTHAQHPPPPDQQAGGNQELAVGSQEIRHDDAQQPPPPPPPPPPPQQPPPPPQQPPPPPPPQQPQQPQQAHINQQGEVPRQHQLPRQHQQPQEQHQAEEQRGWLVRMSTGFRRWFRPDDLEMQNQNRRQDVALFIEALSVSILWLLALGFLIWSSFALHEAIHREANNIQVEEASRSLLILLACMCLLVICAQWSFGLLGRLMR